MSWACGNAVLHLPVGRDLVGLILLLEAVSRRSFATRLPLNSAHCCWMHLHSHHKFMRQVLLCAEASQQGNMQSSANAVRDGCMLFQGAQQYMLMCAHAESSTCAEAGAAAPAAAPGTGSWAKEACCRRLGACGAAGVALACISHASVISAQLPSPAL